MKKFGIALTLALVVAFAAVATALARDGADDPAPSRAAQSHVVADDHGGRGESEPGDDHGGGRDREPGEDVRGNCDEAEHANDASCRGTAGSKPVAGRRLVASVGPGMTISLKTPSGARARILRAGTYTVVVRDRSAEHNFHLTGRGVNKTTSVAGTASTTWRIRFQRGTYTFKCDPHAPMMRGTLRVR